MTSRLGVLAALLAVVVGAAVLLTGGSDPYVVRVALENSNGLEDGSPVTIGGVTRGKVELDLDDRDRVVAALELDEEAGPVGRDARVSIAAANFLGQKRVRLDKGDISKPVPSGATLPRSSVTTPTDLDQVLSVLDADTRTRATILLNEAGEAVVGRKVDIATLLEEFPIGLQDGTRVLRALRADSGRLRELVKRSDRVVAEATAKRRELTRMVDVLGRSAENVGAKRAELRSTLARAPRTLTTMRGFLGELEATAKPLGPAARQLRAAAPPLARTLSEVEPFGKAAIPTLREATDVAPQLTRLASGATPVLRRARPTVRSLGELAGALRGVSSTLDGSSDNLLAILENWSRAIQFRDGLGHVFRGEASYSPELFTSMIERLLPAAPKARRKRARGDRPAATPQRPAARLPEQVRRPAKDLLDRVQEAPAVKDLLRELPDVVRGVQGLAKPEAPRAGQGDQDLLDFLLGP
ncbi:MAG TPA: MlaD family protein [Baekduia sp.]|nr:MlaD family protein [Baekduia sp.]